MIGGSDSREDNRSGIGQVGHTRPAAGTPSPAIPGTFHEGLSEQHADTGVKGDTCR